MSVEKKQSIRIQRGFIAGIIAIGAISIASAFILRNTGDVDASILTRKAKIDPRGRVISGDEFSTNLNRCTTSGVLQTESVATTLTQAEINSYGSGAKAYNIKINEKKASFRLVVAAKKVSSTKAKISYGLTFNDFVSDVSFWGGNSDKMIFLVTGNQEVVTVTYNKINKGSTYTGNFETNYNGTADVGLNIEFQGKNYDGCIVNILSLPEDYQTSTTATVFYIGDANKDGQITEADQVIIQEIVAGTRATPSDICLVDVNKDGQVSILDAVAVARIIEGLDESPGTCPAGGTTTATPTATATKTATATATTSATTGSVSITVKPGFNAYALPSNKKILSTVDLEEEGLTVWTFNRHGDKKWYTTGSTIGNFYHWFGYYIYNPNTSSKTVKVAVSSSQTEPDPYIVKGWNLMANPNSQAKALKDIEFYLTSCPPAAPGKASCSAVGTKTKLSDLFKGSEATQKAYPLIFVIADPYETDADKAFSQIAITDANRETAEIPAGKLFWVYVWPE